MTAQPGVESFTWVIVVGSHHMKYATVKLLASILPLWNNHGCGFVGRQQHGQSTHIVTEIFEQSHLYYEEAQYADY